MCRINHIIIISYYKLEALSLPHTAYIITLLYATARILINTIQASNFVVDGKAETTKLPLVGRVGLEPT